MTEKQNTVEDIFGVDKEALDKSMEIKPALKLGDAAVGTVFNIEFMEDEPREIELKEPRDDGTKTAKVITVKEISVQGASYEATLFLSSKSLALGVARIYKRNQNSLKAKRARIEVGMAEYKEFGKGRCYEVNQIL